ncbi:uncharacterized protein LOC129264913 [Lytechinus pictus]|uniref:uncharacterized protein LOC129264913 n=1 Tax=Lytechinus pictus TaxID=7653 RepID=UPI0030B9F812
MAQPEQQQHQPTVFVQPQPGQPVVVQHQQQNLPNACRAAIPSMHMAMSVTCLVINCIIPGIGTIIAGFGVFCCGNKGQSGGGKFGTFCINFWVGLLQLILSPIGIGYVWAIMWGSIMIYLSLEYHNPGSTTTSVVFQPAVPNQNVVVPPLRTGLQQQPIQPPPQQGYPSQPPPQYPQQTPQEKGYPQQPPPQYPQQPLSQQGYPQQPPPQQDSTPQPPVLSENVADEKH